MDEELKKIFPSELLELLANIAFIGIERGYFKESQEIFSALIEARPHNINSKIAQAIGELMMCHVTDATKLLIACLQEAPNNAIVKGFLVLALKMGKVDNGAISLSKHILKNCNNNGTCSIANEILESYKNTITPHELQSKQSHCIYN